MHNNNILVISNNKETGSIISDKIKLLRECDIIKIVSYIESISVLNSMQPSVILLYCANTDSIDIVKEIRKLKFLDKVPIIFIMDSYIEDMLLYAFDNGIDDFFFLNEPDAVILTRIFLTMQKASLYKQIEDQQDILVAENIIEQETGLYSKEQTPVVFRRFFNKCCGENIENAVFAYVKLTVKDTPKMSLQKIAKKIKSVIRSNDVIGYGKNQGFYIILYNSGIKGAQTVLQRLKNNFENSYNIFVSAVQITAEFDKLEAVLFKTMKEQISSNSDFVYIKDISMLHDESKLPEDEENETDKKQNELRLNYFDSLDKIVAPVFYRIQTSASSKLPDAEIKFDISETESIFSIKQKDLESSVIITFPAYIKIIIDIKNKEKNANPVTKRLTFETDEFSEETLTKLLNDVIQEFVTKLNLNKIYNEGS